MSTIHNQNIQSLEPRRVLSNEEMLFREKVHNMLRKYGTLALSLLSLGAVIGGQKFAELREKDRQRNAAYAAANVTSNDQVPVINTNYIPMYETTPDSSYVSTTPNLSMMMDILPDRSRCSIKGSSMMLPGFHRCPEGKGKESYSGTLMITLPDGTGVSLDIRSAGSDSGKFGLSRGQGDDIEQKFKDWIEANFENAPIPSQADFIKAIEDWRNSDGGENERKAFLELLFAAYKNSLLSKD